MNLLSIFLFAACAICLWEDLFAPEKRMKRFFWKKSLNSDEQTIREFRNQHLILLSILLVMMISFLLTKKNVVLAVGATIYALQFILILRRFRKRI